MQKLNKCLLLYIKQQQYHTHPYLQIYTLFTALKSLEKPQVPSKCTKLLTLRQPWLLNFMGIHYKYEHICHLTFHIMGHLIMRLDLCFQKKAKHRHDIKKFNVFIVLVIDHNNECCRAFWCLCTVWRRFGNKHQNCTRQRHPIDIN